MRQLLNVVFVILIAGCVSSDDSEAIPSLDTGGKADNFYSDVAAEFEVSGVLTLDLTADQFADETYRDNYVSRRLTAFGLYLTTYMTDKFHGIDIDGDGEIGEDEVFFHNVDYGGFHTMVRNHTVEPVEVGDDGEGNYQASFTIDMGGPRDLLEQLAAVPGVTTTTTSVQFDLQMPVGEAVDPEDVPRREIRRFDPADYDGELETIRCTARELPEPADAYPHYNEFMADGVFDITMFFGHDYNTDRWDIQDAQQAFARLNQLGYQSPAQDFDGLSVDSGPFVLEITANGRPVRVEVRLFHSDMFITDRTGQHDLALEEMVARDVFFYNGHAGPYYGFYLDADDMATVYYSEFADLAFDNDRQQIFIAQGCQTYSQYADIVYENPAKNEENLDVIVTVNYSYATGTMGLLENLVSVDEQGNHAPRRFYEVISALNYDWVNDYYNVFYGVTGIDGNPQLHPYANLETLGSACTSSTECGDTSGNICVHYEGQDLCAVYTLTADACPAGSIHGVIEVTGQTHGVCYGLPPEPDPDPTPEAPAVGEVVITEIMANPDVRADSVAEWFEVLNRSEHAVNLSGCLVGDDDGLTHPIDSDLVIQPGDYAVLARTGEPGFEVDFVYGSGYYIANRADEIIISCGNNVIDRVAYTGRVRKGQSFSLPPEALDATSNDDMTAWCYGIESYSSLGDKTDLGTPGTANPICE